MAEEIQENENDNDIVWDPAAEADMLRKKVKQ
jgi:hypothetical protein